jgi:hypothetical protein
MPIFSKTDSTGQTNFVVFGIQQSTLFYRVTIDFGSEVTLSRLIVYEKVLHFFLTLRRTFRNVGVSKGQFHRLWFCGLKTDNRSIYNYYNYIL